MKILHLIPRFTVGGAERLVLEYAKQLPKQGFEIRVASVRGGGDLESGSRNQPPPVGGVPPKAGKSGIVELSGNFWNVMKRLKFFVREWQPDIIHTHIFSSDVAGYLFKRWFPQIKWISAQHNVARQHSWWRRLALRVILKQADQVIAVSPRVAEELGANLGLSQERINLIPNAITLEPWLTVPKVDLLVNKTLRLATIGRLERQKGIDLLLRSLSYLKKIDWHLSIFGTGSLETELKHQARQLGIDNRITWHGVVDNLPERLRDIDVVVAPSRWEGMSLTVMEAMAAGRLVVVSQAAGEGLVENRKTGIVYDTETGNRKLEIRGALEWIEKHRDQARKMAQAARHFAKDNFGIDKHIKELTDVYDKEIRN